MKIFRSSVFFFSVIVVLHSCVPYTYFPQSPQTPASAEKEFHIGCSEIVLMPDIAASYSPVHRLSFGFASDFDLPVPHAGFEAGVAYYDSLHSNLKLGVYGGYGATHFSLRDDFASENGSYNLEWNGTYNFPQERTYRTSDQSYHKVFLQPYVIITGNGVTASGGLKCNYLMYPDFSIKDSVYMYDPDQLDASYTLIQYQKKEGNAFSFQPYISLFVGHKSWQGVLTYAYQWIASSNISEAYLLGKHNMVSIGINKTFSLKKRFLKHTGHYQ